ncbi:MAG: pyridoxal 5'-phosphate synthase glutaminase subunit PdxT [Chloroflexota bacterium]
MDFSTLTIGVLALQGAFLEHIKMIRSLGAECMEVRKPEQLQGLDGLVIPGGESTSMALIAERWGLIEPLKAWVNSGRPTWGTCAGMIMLSNQALGQKQGGQALIGGLDVLVERNHFGRQVDSFETDMVTELLGGEPFQAIFIRAPAITQVGPGVEILVTVQNQKDESVIAAVRQGAILATSFHPELTADSRWHEYFLNLVHST